MQDEFSRLLKYARKDAHLTQKQLAALLGVATGTVQQWELGLRFPRPEMLEKLEDKLGVCFLFCNADIAKENERILNSLGEPENRKEDQQAHLENRMKKAFSALNETGQTVACERVEELAKIDDYKRTEPAETLSGDSEGSCTSQREKPSERPSSPSGSK